MALAPSSKSALAAQSEIRAMTLACTEAGGINMAQGVCDMDAPEAVVEGAAAAMRRGENAYTRYDGREELRRAVARKLDYFYDITADPESEITITVGATGAFYCACLALLEPGDEAIWFKPGYGYHPLTLKALDMVPVAVELTGEDWSFTARDLEEAVSNRTRAIIVNTPSNPTGKVFTRAELEVVADFARSHDLFVFTDEIYEHFLYDGRTHLPPAALPGMAERTITMSGFSKCFSITGWRLGYCVCPAPLARAVGNFGDMVYVCPPAPLQLGAAAGLDELPMDYYRSLSADHQHKRDRFCRALAEAGLAPHVPQGAYYVLADLSPLPGKTAKERAMHLLRETGIACVPGNAFLDGPWAETLGRFCFAKRPRDLDLAIDRLRLLS